MKLVCVAGKNNIAVDVLQYLKKYSAGRYELCVICNKTENGINSQQKSLRFFAEKMKISECKLEDLYDIEDLIFLSLEFDQIVDPNKFTTKKLYNIHFSLLPSYKGMYTSVWPILNGERLSGVTLHYIEHGIDTGDIIAQKEFNIEGMNCRDLYQANMRYGKELVLENIEELIMGNPIARPQSAKKSSYYSRFSINYNQLEIDLKQTANGICNQIQAFSYREFQLPKVHNNRIIDAKILSEKSKGKPGTIILETEEFLLLNTIDYNIVMFRDRLEELLKACNNGDIAMVKSICNVSRHINDYDINGITPLMIAVLSNQKEIAEFLIAHGADINAVDNNGRSVLMYAKDAFVKYGDSTVFKLLRALGAKLEVKDYAGNTIYDYLNKENLTLDLLNK